MMLHGSVLCYRLCVFKPDSRQTSGRFKGGGTAPPPVALTVAVAVSELDSTDLIFIETGVKINGAYYRDVLLSEHLLPAMKELSANDFFIFQQEQCTCAQG